MPFSKKRNVKDDLDLIYLIAPQKNGTTTAKGVGKKYLPLTKGSRLSPFLAKTLVKKMDFTKK